MIAETIIEEILQTVAESKTPIKGGQYKSTLSKEYAKFKMEENGNSDANLDLTGSMLSSLSFEDAGENQIKVGVFGLDARKADGHNNFSGESKLPKRQFLPEEGQEFKSNIQRLISQVVLDFKADNVGEVPEINSKSELYDFLRDEIGDYSNRKLRDLALSSERLRRLLDEEDLLDLL